MSTGSSARARRDAGSSARARRDAGSSPRARKDAGSSPRARKDAGSSPRARKDARRRLLAAARTLFQARGYHAVGIAEILIRAGAPKGSLYHHFPDGKAQLAVAVVEDLGASIVRYLGERRAEGIATADLIAETAENIATWLARRDWRQGALLGVLAPLAQDEPMLAEAVRRAYADWRAALARALGAEGWPDADARREALLTVASLEGALLLARVEKDPGPLRLAGEAAEERLRRPPAAVDRQSA